MESPNMAFQRVEELIIDGQSRGASGETGLEARDKI